MGSEVLCPSSRLLALDRIAGAVRRAGKDLGLSEKWILTDTVLALRAGGSPELLAVAKKQLKKVEAAIHRMHHDVAKSEPAKTKGAQEEKLESEKELERSDEDDDADEVQLT